MFCTNEMSPKAIGSKELVFGFTPWIRSEQTLNDVAAHGCDENSGKTLKRMER